MRILIAEDSVTMRKVIQMTFAGENVELLAVDNGELAIERGREFRPDVMFIDASLPGTDGYEVTRAVKSDPQLSGVPIILMASQQHPYDNARGAQVGADDHIVKPFDSQEAIDKANRMVGSLPVVDVASISAPTNVPPAAAARAPEPSRDRPPPPLPVSQAMVGSGSTVSSRPAAPQGGTRTVSSVAPPRSPMPPISAPAPKSAGPAPHLGASGAAERLAALGLNPEQVDGVLKISAEVVERVVWEVVPQLAEAMIREELQRLTGE